MAYNTLDPLPSLDDIALANKDWVQMQQEHADPINGTVGVLLDQSTGKALQPMVVQDARRQGLEEILSGNTFGYQTQKGHEPFLNAVSEWVLGPELYENRRNNLQKLQALGGTGALTMASVALGAMLSNPGQAKPSLELEAGWGNHKSIFGDVFNISSYEHLDEAGNYNHVGALGAIEKLHPEAAVLLQACGYNDDGIDRTPEQWDELFVPIKKKGHAVIIDAAYLGLADGFEADTYPIRKCVSEDILSFICISASKNMGLYNSRVGALLIANADANRGRDQAERIIGKIPAWVRKTYSNPPLETVYGAGLVLGDTNLRRQLETEIEASRQLLQLNRRSLAAILGDKAPTIGAGKGLFMKLQPEAFSDEQQALFRQKGILVLRSSARFNIGGIKPEHIQRVGSAFLEALALRPKLS
jgi:aromatic-amino-acid transaminase